MEMAAHISRRAFIAVLAAMMVWTGAAFGATNHADRIASLIAPTKLATLGKRGANPRIQKAVAQLEMAKRDGQSIEKVAAKAAGIAGYTNALAAKLTAESLVRNHDIASKLGCLDEAGLAEMRQGKSAAIQRGPYRGQELSVDHIIPRAVVPELDNVIANLELMPLKMNQSKNDKVGSRQKSLAKQFHSAGLLSASGLNEVNLR